MQNWKIFSQPGRGVWIRPVFATALLAASLGAAITGCKNKQDKAIEQAKQQAAATGQQQQVITTDANGNTVTTTVQPPAAGQKDEVVTTTVTPKAVATGAAADSSSAAPAAQTTMAAAPQPPPPPAIHVPAGTALAIRIDQRISAKGSHPGQKFTGEIFDEVKQGDSVVIPKGTPVDGVVDSAKQRGHFKGASNLSLRLTSLTLNGKDYPLDTAAMRERKKGKGKRTAAFVGGGTGLGMLLGGVAGGGKGALIGGLAGAGAGTAGAGLTGNRDLVIPAESIVRFKLADDLEIQP